MPGPKRANPSYDYFQYDEKIKKSKCLVGDCNEQVAGRGGNLERHLQRKHKDVFVSVQEKKQENNKALDERDDGKKKPVKVEIDSSIILNSCIEIVTVNGRPFSYLDDSGFRKILAPILAALPEKIAISAESVRYQIQSCATRLREALKKEISEKMVSVKIDCCTSCQRQIFGVNIQYIR